MSSKIERKRWLTESRQKSMNTPENTNWDSVESTALFALSWHEEYDDDDNSIYEAASPYHEDGSPFYFRLRQRLRDNKHEFYEASDAEVMMDEDNPRIWESLEAAKAAMQTDANDIVREYQANDRTLATHASSVLVLPP